MLTCLTRVFLASQLTRCVAIAPPTAARAVSRVKPRTRATHARHARTNCRVAVSRRCACENLSRRFVRKDAAVRRNRDDPSVRQMRIEQRKWRPRPMPNLGARRCPRPEHRAPNTRPTRRSRSTPSHCCSTSTGEGELHCRRTHPNACAEQADIRGAGAPAEVRMWRAPIGPPAPQPPPVETTPPAGANFRNSASVSPDKVSHPGWDTVQILRNQVLQCAEQVALPPWDFCVCSLLQSRSLYQPAVKRRTRLTRWGPVSGQRRASSTSAKNTSRRLQVAPLRVSELAGAAMNRR